MSVPKNRQKISGVCPVLPKGGGGVNVLGSGNNLNITNSDLQYFDYSDVKRKIRKKYDEDIEFESDGNLI